MPARSGRSVTSKPACRASSAAVSAWPGTEFQHRDAARGQQSRKRGKQAAIGRESVRAAVERGARLMAGHLGHQAAEILGANIGRVAQDKVEPAVERLRPVAADETRAVGQMQRRGIARGQGRGVGRPVHADAERGGELRQRGEQQAAGAGAEIQHQPRRRAAGETLRAPPRSAFPTPDAGSARRAKRRTPGSRTPAARGSAPAAHAPRAARAAARAGPCPPAPPGSRSSAAGVAPSACASSSRASSRGLSMPACRSRSAARPIAC